MTNLVIDHPISGVERWTLSGEEKLNALDSTLRSALVEAVHAVGQNDEVRAVLLTGKGRAFSAGGDVQAMGSRTPVQSINLLLYGRQIVEGMYNLRKPVIAAVNGIASGAGFNLALAADIILSAPDAWYQQSFIKMGLGPDMGGSYLLSQQIGLHRAKHALLTARRFSAQEGLELGFISEILDGDFEQRSLEYVAELLKRAPIGLGVTKWVVNQSAKGDLSQALDLETFTQTMLSSTADHKSAVEAFKAKEDLDTIQFKGE